MDRENEVMRLLKTHELRTLIHKTPLGDLEIKRTKGEDEYVFTLDAVPLDKDIQKELSKLFKINV